MKMKRKIDHEMRYAVIELEIAIIVVNVRENNPMKVNIAKKRTNERLNKK